jgi:molybdate transport system substrate-binding protein
MTAEYDPARNNRRVAVAEIKVLSCGAVESMVKALGAEYEKTSGDKLDLKFGTAGSLRARFDGGEVPDLIVLPTAMTEVLEKAGRFVPGSRIDLGRTVTGVVVKEGARAPDISTPDTFKQALLNAKTVSYTNPKAGGSSGTYMSGLLQKLGIADEIGKKAVLGKRGYEVAEAVADGRAEIGTTFISEALTVKGVTVVGPLPGDLYHTNTYTAAIPAGSAQPEAALRLLDALTKSETRGRWTEAGLEPAFPVR